MQYSLCPAHSVIALTVRRTATADTGHGMAVRTQCRAVSHWRWRASVSLLLFCLGGATATRGAEIGPDALTFAGFGTFGMVYHDETGLEYRRSITQRHGASAGEIDLATDSLFGLQVTGALRPDLQIVVQGITRLNADGNWNPQLALGFLRYAPDAAVLLRAGRIGYDTYLLAESPAVGYSYLPIRPAPEFFGLFATDNLDGADATYTHPAGNGMVRARVFAGYSSGEQASADGVRTSTDSRVFGGMLDYSYHEWLVRLGAIGIHVVGAPDLSGLAAALRATGTPEAIALADELNSTNRSIRAVQFAVAYDGHPIQGQLMLTRLNSDMPVGPKLNSGVATIGYRYRHATPFLSFAIAKSFANIQSTGLPDVPPFDALNAAAHTVQTAGQTTQRTLSAGVRYDLTPHVDLKLQVDHVQSGETNLVFDRAVAPRDQAHMTLFGLAVDFVF